MTARTSASADHVVLDTNVWLDCLVFAEVSVEPLHACLRAGRAIVVRTDEMRDEWLDVIGRAGFRLDDAQRAAASLAFDRMSSWRPRAPSCPLLCSDPADRKFVDLAVAERARWLVTKDKALLKLARRAQRGYGLSIVRPDAPALLSGLADPGAQSL